MAIKPSVTPNPIATQASEPSTHPLNPLPEPTEPLILNPLPDLPPTEPAICPVPNPTPKKIDFKHMSFNAAEIKSNGEMIRELVVKGYTNRSTYVDVKWAIGEGFTVCQNIMGGPSTTPRQMTTAELRAFSKTLRAFAKTLEPGDDGARAYQRMLATVESALQPKIQHPGIAKR